MIDAAVVKGMLLRGDRRHDIAAWFGVSGRIAEIMNFAEVIATPAGPVAACGTVPQSAGGCRSCRRVERYQKSPN